MMRLNLHIGPVKTKITSTQKMDISEMNTQQIPNFHVCSSDGSKSKRINADKTLSYVCSMDKRKS